MRCCLKASHGFAHHVRFLFVWTYEASPATDPAGDMTLPLSPRGRDTGRINKGVHLGGSWELFTGILGDT